MVDIQELKQIQKQMSKVIEENKRIQYIKEKYVEISDEVDAIADGLAEVVTNLKRIAGKLDPVKTMSTRVHTVYKTNFKDIVRESYDKIQAGTNMTLLKLEGLYSDEETQRLRNVMTKLKTLSNVSATKDGTKLRLFKTIGG